MTGDKTTAPMIDTHGAPDIFISGLGEIEDLGGGVRRFIFYSKHTVGGREELVVVAKLIMQQDIVPGMMRATSRELGICVCESRGRGVAVN